MNNERGFRILLTFASGLLTLTRIYYGKQAVQAGRTERTRPILVSNILLDLVGGVAALMTVLYILRPRWLAWARVSLPPVLRWVGVGLAALTVGLFLWVHQSLGRNWAMPLEQRAGQGLVTHGPYRWVRHPMYTTLTLWAIAFFLLSANALVGLAWLGLMVLVLPLVGREEAELGARFGEAYRIYQQQTGRFLPRWRD
ncbi:MAG: isoprenylcysteine carboxylmethyltransferase family protein [Ardenticatenales bacterium]|nr:isoprenylcysteine carboxylmethyltransferase family protein [Ardenticatenales bacterium]